MQLEQILRAWCWYNIPERDVRDVLSKHAIYDRRYRVFWFKLAGFANTLSNYELEIRPCGGLQTRYGATYFAQCKNGEIESVQKNRHEADINLTDLYDGDPEVAAKIRKRVEKHMDIQPFKPPEELHSIKYGVLRPRMAVGRHRDGAALDVYSD